MQYRTHKVMIFWMCRGGADQIQTKHLPVMDWNRFGGNDAALPAIQDAGRLLSTRTRKLLLRASGPKQELDRGNRRPVLPFTVLDYLFTSAMIAAE